MIINIRTIKTTSFHVPLCIFLTVICHLSRMPYFSCSYSDKPRDYIKSANTSRQSPETLMYKRFQDSETSRDTSRHTSRVTSHLTSLLSYSPPL